MMEAWTKPFGLYPARFVLSCKTILNQSDYENPVRTGSQASQHKHAKAASVAGLFLGR